MKVGKIKSLRKYFNFRGNKPIETLVPPQTQLPWYFHDAQGPMIHEINVDKQ